MTPLILTTLIAITYGNHVQITRGLSPHECVEAVSMWKNHETVEEAAAEEIREGAEEAAREKVCRDFPPPKGAINYYTCHPDESIVSISHIMEARPVDVDTIDAAACVEP